MCATVGVNIIKKIASCEGIGNFDACKYANKICQYLLVVSYTYILTYIHLMVYMYLYAGLDGL